MNLQMVSSLFTLFSGETEVDRFMALLMAAVSEVRAHLLPEADGSEARLCYLAAAVANLRYTQLFGARDKALATYAGTIARQSNEEHQLRFAERLVSSYRALCSDLLRDEAFLFWGVRG